MASNANLDVRPSDLDQALVRVVFVSAVVVWSYANAPASSPLEALHYKYFTLAFSYWTFSLLAYGWTYFFIQRVAPDSAVLIASRIIRKCNNMPCTLGTPYGKPTNHLFV